MATPVVKWDAPYGKLSLRSGTAAENMDMQMPNFATPKIEGSERLNTPTFMDPGFAPESPMQVPGSAPLSVMGDFTGSEQPAYSSIGDGAVAGGWMEKGKFGLGVAQVGLGVYNALEQSKMNKFMKSYYGDQVALQTADFQNNARSTNEALTRRRERQLDSQGVVAGGAESSRQVGDYMKEWGVQETV